ncbi:hypothetical protein PTNB85_07068 [Pyrenophora teres f. teres]|uniref:Uncharacterized protein n=1 Tax=Pyrenophora teres f. teres TaxID=97479 RepID=A0A6S6WC74_9PLEO|nr:hypothetical protein HRS9139_07104 [Pyrenophora teres f. teres]KAE8830481.1 hypothetical protein PTNB85_07068 [Pyrenophora teres f. teres]KAE8857518.1 hypothetical protein PTNB29_08585 [Pyrenophora teres f. teres]CAE7185243.1 hypothetical protein PTTW11_06770 [Pyrenophora teres f. teres]
MDESDSDMVDFVIVPREPVKACVEILSTLSSAINKNVNPKNENNTGEFGKLLGTLSSTVNKNVNSKNDNNTGELGKLIADGDKLHTVASWWLDRAPVFGEDREYLKIYLQWPRGFSASGLETFSRDGHLKKRHMVLLEQYGLSMHEAREKKRMGPRNNTESKLMEKRLYLEFMSSLMWMREDAIERMFEPGFRGTYVEHEERPINEDASLAKFDDLSFADTDSVASAQDTPATTTRAASPAPTERPFQYNNDYKDHQRKDEPPKLPKLKYVAIIETETDKAVYNIEPRRINGEVRKKLESAKEMCDEMIMLGYEGKVKLQDFMDVGMKMARK